MLIKICILNSCNIYNLKCGMCIRFVAFYFKSGLTEKWLFQFALKIRRTFALLTSKLRLLQMDSKILIGKKFDSLVSIKPAQGLSYCFEAVHTWF